MLLKKPMVALVAAISLLSFTGNSGARGTNILKVHQAINLYWCGKANKYCKKGWEAWRVAGCETGQTYNVWAGYKKHDYWGIFQMGSYARAKYGHGWNPWIQARAAYHYYRDAHGWSPWSCAWAAE